MATYNNKTGIWAWVGYDNDGDVKVMMVNENCEYLVQQCGRASYGFVIFWPDCVMLKEAVNQWLGLVEPPPKKAATTEEFKKLKDLIRNDLREGVTLGMTGFERERLVGRLAGTVLYDFLERKASTTGGHCNLENSVIHYFSFGKPSSVPICEQMDRNEWVTYDHTATGRICPDCQRMLGRKIF